MREQWSRGATETLASLYFFINHNLFFYFLFSPYFRNGSSSPVCFLYFTREFIQSDNEFPFAHFAMTSNPFPSRQILVPRTSRGCPPPTSPGRLLKILFYDPGDVSIWRPRYVSIWRSGDVLKWRQVDVLIWRSRDIPGRLIRDVPRTFSGRPLEDLQSTQAWISQNFF